MKIEKKILSKYFEKILEGTKSYELRLADFECKEICLYFMKSMKIPKHSQAEL